MLTWSGGPLQVEMACPEAQLTVIWSLEWVQLGESQLGKPQGLISLLVQFITNGLFIKY